MQQADRSSERQKRKRTAASCSQCYSKKQKCDHQYPCNNCTKRRQPELCSYGPSSRRHNSEHDVEWQATDKTQKENHGADSESIKSPGKSDERSGHESFPPVWTKRNGFDLGNNMPACFGYFEGSKSNMLGMMAEFKLLESGFSSAKAGTLTHGADNIKAKIKLFPTRSVLNSLVQNFFKEINWIYEMVHPPKFLTRYETWWKGFPGSCTDDFEFAILILRLCAYSAQFLPSRTYTADTVDGIALNTIREHCHSLANDLLAIYEPTLEQQSPCSVQSLFFAACYSKNQGRMKEAWFQLGSAIRLAQDLGMHLEPSGPSTAHLNDLEKEMRRRIFWNLYIWDRFLSLVLNRLPCIMDADCTVDLPKMRLGPYAKDSDAPDPSLERVLSARLIRIWGTFKPINQGSGYDPATVEEQYEKLREAFISQLPPVFAFQDSDTRWDEKLPMLPRQRQMLHISVLVLICHLLRPVLQVQAAQVRNWPQYKRNLALTHRGYLVNTALSLLQSVAQLHQLMGGNQNRYFLLSFYTFEPAMILGMHLLSLDQALEILHTTKAIEKSRGLWNRPLNVESAKTMYADAPSIRSCREQIQESVNRLCLLKEVSVIGSTGYEILNKICSKLESFNQPDSLQQYQDSSLKASSLESHPESLLLPGLESTPNHVSPSGPSDSDRPPMIWSVSTAFDELPNWDDGSLGVLQDQDMFSWIIQADASAGDSTLGYDFAQHSQQHVPNTNAMRTGKAILGTPEVAPYAYKEDTNSEEHAQGS